MSGCRNQTRNDSAGILQKWQMARRQQILSNFRCCKAEERMTAFPDLTGLRSTFLLAAEDSSTSAPTVSCHSLTPFRILVEAWETTSSGTFGWRHRNIRSHRPRGRRFLVAKAVRPGCVVPASYTAFAVPGGNLLQRDPLAQYTARRQGRKWDNTCLQGRPWGSIPAVVGLHTVGKAEHESLGRVCALKASGMDDQAHHAQMAELDNGTAVLDGAVEA